MHQSMEIYPQTAAERAMKLQEVLLRATSGKVKWWEAARADRHQRAADAALAEAARGARPSGITGPAAA